MLWLCALDSIATDRESLPLAARMPFQPNRPHLNVDPRVEGPSAKAITSLLGALRLETPYLRRTAFCSIACRQDLQKRDQKSNETRSCQAQALKKQTSAACRRGDWCKGWVAQEPVTAGWLGATLNRNPPLPILLALGKRHRRGRQQVVGWCTVGESSSCYCTSPWTLLLLSSHHCIALRACAAASSSSPCHRQPAGLCAARSICRGQASTHATCHGDRETQRTPSRTIRPTPSIHDTASYR